MFQTMKPSFYILLLERGGGIGSGSPSRRLVALLVQFHFKSESGVCRPKPNAGGQYLLCPFSIPRSTLQGVCWDKSWRLWRTTGKYRKTVHLVPAGEENASCFLIYLGHGCCWAWAMATRSQGQEPGTLAPNPYSGYVGVLENTGCSLLKQLCKPWASWRTLRSWVLCFKAF